MSAFLKYIYISIATSSSSVNIENGQILRPVRFAYIWEKYILSSRNALLWNPW